MLALPDTFVRVVLGPRWLDAAPIVAWLGIAMIYQPVAFTTGCLLMSQNRSRLMLRQGVVTSGVSMLSFVVGLPFGPTWVAAAYVISGAVVRLPFIFWQVGKKGPVRTRDQYRLFLPTIWSGTFLTLSYYGLRTISGLLEHPLLLLVCAGVITLPITCATLAILPSGRALMRDSVTIIGLALSRSHAT
jgi:PST family polysaccharide transporter